MPNCITASRIVLSIILLIVKPLSLTFFILYAICGLTDILDGFTARKTGTAGKLGAKLDSAADTVMFLVLLYILYPVIKPSKVILLWIAFIFAIRMAAIFFAFKKYKTYASLHTYSNKATGIMLFIFPFLLSIQNKAAVVFIICIIASLSAIEELSINILSEKLDLNRKSIFTK